MREVQKAYPKKKINGINESFQDLRKDVKYRYRKQRLSIKFKPGGLHPYTISKLSNIKEF